MSERLIGKRIMVIGAGTGIGGATVRRLCSEGARVCVADLNRDAAYTLAEEIAQVGQTAFAVGIDIADEASVEACFATAVNALGGMDGVHVNAADMRTLMIDTDAVDVPLEVFDRTIAVNLRGHFLCTRKAIPILLAAGGGALVYTSSGASEQGEPQRPSYAMAKSAINALVRHISSRWGKQAITANAIAPGFVMTPEMIAAGNVPQEWINLCMAACHSPRLGKAEDIAAMAAFLLSEDSRWVNGQVFHVNGGALYR